MIAFLLNDKSVQTVLPPGMVMVDFIRYHQHLTGTKIGCREGDCGACTVLAGELKNGQLSYSAVTSCLMPLANAHGKHIVTVEGINVSGLNAIQQVICDESATQCGFCTPGFVMSLAGFCLTKGTMDGEDNHATFTPAKAIAAVDGNICRCTGYKSVERAATRLTELLRQHETGDRLSFLINNSVLPAYFAGVAQQLERLAIPALTTSKENLQRNGTHELLPTGEAFIGGGTDLYVQRPEVMLYQTDQFIFNEPQLKGVSMQGNRCVIGGAATVTDILQAPVMQEQFPELPRFMKLVSSTPIRNMATIAGNFINASPIGDMSIFFLALDAQLVLSDGVSERELALQDLFQGYKKLAKQPTEYIKQIWFRLPAANTHFNFEKVSKRTHLDIASVNTALLLTVEDNIIRSAALSAGGVAPVPLFLTGTSKLMKGRELSAATIHAIIEQALSEVSPISDIRGTATYKRLLLKQLIKAHFFTMFPYLEKEELIYG